MAFLATKFLSRAVRDVRKTFIRLRAVRAFPRAGASALVTFAAIADFAALRVAGIARLVNVYRVSGNSLRGPSGFVARNATLGRPARAAIVAGMVKQRTETARAGDRFDRRGRRVTNAAELSGLQFVEIMAFSAGVMTGQRSGVARPRVTRIAIAARETGVVARATMREIAETFLRTRFRR